MSRLTDSDTTLGPFRWGPLNFKDRSFKILVRSGDEEYRGAKFQIWGLRRVFELRLPGWLIKPKRKKVKVKWSREEFIERHGKDWYDTFTEREFGFGYHSTYFSIYYGQQPLDSSKDCRWAYAIPWLQWRWVRTSFYDVNGDHFWSELTGDRDWKLKNKMETECPKVRFRFADYDGEEIEAVTHIEEMAWERGAGWFKWLSYIAKPKVRRSLDIEFSSEVGPRKGSWKGGTLGHGIDAQGNELHQSAFLRYCKKYNLDFIEVI